MAAGNRNTLNRNERRRAAKGGGDLARGFSAHQAGDLRTAEAIYRKILAADADDPEATRLLCEVLISQGSFTEALRRLERLVRQHPRHFSLHYSFGNALRLSGQAETAIAAYRTALDLEPQSAGALHGLGMALQMLECEAEAAEAFAAAARADPNWAVAWQGLGLSLAALGRLGMAAEALRRAISIDPGLAEARRHFLALAPEAGDAAMLQKLLDDPRTQEPEKVETGFALGKMLDRAGRTDEAFAAFAAANRRLRQLQTAAGHVFDRARLQRDVDRLIATFPSAGFAGNASALPVFVVGMPRAGSSLVEQILASHGQVFGAGEFGGIGAIANRLGWAPSPAWTPSALAAEAEKYLAELSRRGGPALRVVDKMPDNIFQLGLIAALFPNARIIFCARDPLDTCFSCFTQRFAQPLAFDTDLADCGFRYREVERLTRHWLAALPLRMLTVSYETLVGDLESEARRMVAFLGLDWESACLNFASTERVVRTASWAQVRQPLYNHAVGRATHYAAHLAPLIAALNPGP